jgi:hypothetical protein
LNTPEVETFLARLYMDEGFLARFLESPGEVLEREKFSSDQRAALAAIDRSELMLAASSYRHIRDNRKSR